MRITKNQLRRIIKEEVQKVLSDAKMAGGRAWEAGIGKGTSQTQDVRSTADSNKLFGLKSRLFDKLEAILDGEDDSGEHWLKNMPRDGNIPGYNDLENTLMSKGDYTVEKYIQAIKEFLTNLNQTNIYNAFLKASKLSSDAG